MTKIINEHWHYKKIILRYYSFHIHYIYHKCFLTEDEEIIDVTEQDFVILLIKKNVGNQNIFLV